MSKKVLTILVCVAVVVLTLSCPIVAEDPYQVAWTALIGTSYNDASKSVAVDGSGNVYISGYTKDSLGGGTYAGAEDAFLSKFDASGNELWSQQIGTTYNDVSFSVAVDASGNAYISGCAQGSLGGGTYAGGYDAFLAKYDTSGNKLWLQQIGTTSSDGSHSVAVDGSGNAYISGWTNGSLGGTNAGYSDAFLTKFDASGNELWSQQIGTLNYDISRSVAVDASGNAYISGNTARPFGHVGDDSDAFLTKFDASGNELWSQQIGTSGWDESRSVAVDGSGNAYISGWTDGSLGGTNAGGHDAFLVKFDASGNELWSQQIGTSSEDRSYSLAVDGSDNAYISGYTKGSLLGGPNAGNADAFLTKFDASGNILWSQQIGTSRTDRSYSVAVDGSDNAYISGGTYGNLGGTNAGDYDAFLVKFVTPEPATIFVMALGGIAMLRRKRK